MQNKFHWFWNLIIALSNNLYISTTFKAAKIRAPHFFLILQQRIYNSYSVLWSFLGNKSTKTFLTTYFFPYQSDNKAYLNKSWGWHWQRTWFPASNFLYFCTFRGAFKPFARKFLELKMSKSASIVLTNFDALVVEGPHCNTCWEELCL